MQEKILLEDFKEEFDGIAVALFEKIDSNALNYMRHLLLDRGAFVKRSMY